MEPCPAMMTVVLWLGSSVGFFIKIRLEGVENESQ